ncbi:hypothetical protein RIF29_41022 [Crotalaria pallida]|uniref:RNase H type-1 domain-containing protein n=1 Tax=Crotalaria pallida TaxID=3830 RepID=A0AAN9E6J9_CROPI
MLAELLSLKNGLLLAWDARFKNVHCETDSLEAYQLFSMVEIPAFHMYAVLVQQICDTLALKHSSLSLCFNPKVCIFSTSSLKPFSATKR